MLSEGIHSTVDSTNQLLLRLGINKVKNFLMKHILSATGRNFISGQSLFLVLIFVIGGGMSVYEGIIHINHPEHLNDPTWNYIVLACAAVFAGISFIISIMKFIERCRRKKFWNNLRNRKDPALFVIIFEDGAALAGLFIAFLGVFLRNYFQLPVLDGVASILIGLVLAIVAVILITESRHLLIGKSAYKEKVQGIYDIVNSDNDVYKLYKPLTMRMEPGEVLLALDVNFKTEISSEQIILAVQSLEKKIMEKYPDVKQIYIEAKNLSNNMDKK